MSKKIKNYKKELKVALRALVDLPGHDVAMHLALATSDYEKIDDISDKTLLELINTYISLNEIDVDFDPESFNYEDDYDEEEEDLING